ncbi:MAG TPA: hypothetical protein VKA95_04240 [Nitrososphaeraceae archaeon]|nr:hypothetical protein [Nitrososphaeraceae archaeon]
MNEVGIIFTLVNPDMCMYVGMFPATITDRFEISVVEFFYGRSGLSKIISALPQLKSTNSLR